MKKALDPKFNKECTCPTCGKQWQNYISQKGGKFCSVACYRVSRAMVERPCEICRIVFKPSQKAKSGKFCSLACYWKSMKISDEEYRKRSNARVRKYRKEHPEWTKIQKNKRRALEMGAEGNFTEEEWNSLKEKHNNKCAHCKEEKKLTIDHIKSLSKGGSNYIENIQPLCRNCNSSKWIKEVNGQRYSLNTAGMS